METKSIFQGCKRVKGRKLDAADGQNAVSRAIPKTLTNSVSRQRKVRPSAKSTSIANLYLFINTKITTILFVINIIVT